MMPERSDRASSGRGCGVALVMLFAIVALWPALGGAAVRLWSLGIAALLLLAALARPSLLAPLSRLFNALAIGLVYYLVLTPIAIAARSLGKDPLRRKLERGAASYWIVRDPPGPAPDSIRRQF